MLAAVFGPKRRPVYFSAYTLQALGVIRTAGGVCSTDATSMPPQIRTNLAQRQQIHGAAPNRNASARLNSTSAPENSEKKTAKPHRPAPGAAFPNPVDVGGAPR
jgi:hypothetical protein